MTRDRVAGGLIVLCGLTVALESWTHTIGTLRHMGSGYFPAVLGVALIILGVLIAIVPAIRDSSQDTGIPKEWKGWAFILGGVIGFIVLGRYFGLVAATFSCVFLSSLGDRGATLQTSFLLSVGVTLFCVLLFHSVLGLNFPLFAWFGH